MNTEITLVQNPIIQHRLENIGKRITERIESLNLENQVATEDTVSALKKMRAELNKEFLQFEEQRKAIKNAIMQPYNDFDEIFKEEIGNKFKNADDILKKKINDSEMEVKTEKRNNLQSYFNELVEYEGIDWLTFDRWNVEINLSTTEKKYREMLLEFIGKIVEDLDLIKTEPHEAEILVEYKKTLNASQSITMIRQRKNQEKLERERIIRKRTDDRIDKLNKILFVYSDIAHAYYFVQNDTVSISLKDIETLENEEWNKRYVSLESEAAKHTQKENKPEILNAPVSERSRTDRSLNQSLLSVAEATEIPDLAKELVTSATLSNQSEEIHQAKFCVQGTMGELMKLKDFLVSNNYKYQNI